MKRTALLDEAAPWPAVLGRLRLVAPLLAGMASALASCGRELRYEPPPFDAIVGADSEDPFQLVVAAGMLVGYTGGLVSAEDVRWVALHPLVDAAVPVCLGDSFSGYPVVATSPDMLDALQSLSEGRGWSAESREAVLGAEVAAAGSAGIGDVIKLAHGRDLHPEHEAPFRIVGILLPTSTAYDRAVFVPRDSFYELDGHRSDLQGAVSAILVRTRGGNPRDVLPEMRGIQVVADLAAAFEQIEGDEELAARYMDSREAKLLMRSGRAPVSPSILAVCAAALVASAVGLRMRVIAAARAQQVPAPALRSPGAAAGFAVLFGPLGFWYLGPRAFVRAWLVIAPPFLAYAFTLVNLEGRLGEDRISSYMALGIGVSWLLSGALGYSSALEYNRALHAASSGSKEAAGTR